MKRLICIFMVLALCLSMGACAGKSTDPTVTESAPEETLTITEPVTEPETEATEPPTEATEPPTEVTEPETEATEPETEATEDNGRDYILNTNTGKFHYPSCSSVDAMKESNKAHYHGTRDELIEQGYSPCGRCHP